MLELGIEQEQKKIPYGISNFMDLQKSNFYYVDKTHFIPTLERAGRYLFLIRPRRIGKSLWLSTLFFYYDLYWKDSFEQVFRETYIQKHPTAERNSYLILKFNFSLVNPDPRYLEESFEEYGQTVIQEFLRKYQNFLEEDWIQEIQKKKRVADKLNQLFAYTQTHPLKIYILIDEYDNFANVILSTQGKDQYHNLTHGSGFFRYFFNVLKGGTSESGLGTLRLFITGVSPITMDDVTSGFNIGLNLSLLKSTNEILGFTESETKALLSYYEEYFSKTPSLDFEQAFSLMKQWYDGYCFSRSAITSLFNSDMVLYFMNYVLLENQIPEEMMDRNIRIDYGKLRHLIIVDQQQRVVGQKKAIEQEKDGNQQQKLNGNFSLLQKVLEKGEADSFVVESFPLEKLTHSSNFHSLLYYFGLLSYKITEAENRSLPVNRLVIPNETVRRLMYSYLREAYEEAGYFRIDLLHFTQLLHQMAYVGEWRPVFQFLAQEIRQQTGGPAPSIRDYLSEEKVVQGFLLAYLNATDFMINLSEVELNKGYTDFFLSPFQSKYPHFQYAYLIELKYISKKKFEDKLLKETIQEAQRQLDQYSQDPHFQKKIQGLQLRKIILVFRAWELIYAEEAGMAIKGTEK